MPNFVQKTSLIRRNEFKPPKRIYFGFTPLKDDSLDQEESNVNPETTANLKRDAQFNIFKAFKPIRLVLT